MPLPRTTCWSCHHVLDNDQDRCPECGEARSVELTPAFTADYGRARDLLDGASLLLGPHDPSGPLGGFAAAGYVLDGGVNLRSLCVAAGQEAEAIKLLDEHGIALAGGGTVVDVSESNCPSCGAVLRTGSAAGTDGACSGCGIRFTWIDVSS